MQYDCKKVSSDKEIPWDQVESMVLKDVVTGGDTRLATTAKACWTDEALYIRFECEDDYVVATLNRRDDPLYREDVVEVFIDEERTGHHYIELEVSPINVIFDALVDNNLAGSIQVNQEWNAEGLSTEVMHKNGSIVYDIIMPFTLFRKPPKSGTSWHWNVYRIDTDPEGGRHYWAWSPTGEVNFHKPLRFGIINFY